MRQSVAAFALITQRVHDQTQWLAQWNANWSRFNFVGGHKREHESFRECVVREIEEELGLVDSIDIAVDAAPTAHLEYSAWSHSAQEDTRYTMELFGARLLTNQARKEVESNLANRWLREPELERQRTSDGKQVSETMWLLLSHTRLVSSNRLDETRADETSHDERKVHDA